MYIVHRLKKGTLVLFLYFRTRYNKRLKLFFEYKITFEFGYFKVKKHDVKC